MTQKILKQKQQKNLFIFPNQERKTKIKKIKQNKKFDLLDAKKKIKKNGLPFFSVRVKSFIT